MRDESLISYPPSLIPHPLSLARYSLRLTMSEASLRILLIEDNPADADLLGEMLAGAEQRSAPTRRQHDASRVAA